MILRYLYNALMLNYDLFILSWVQLSRKLYIGCQPIVHDCSFNAYNIHSLIMTFAY